MKKKLTYFLLIVFFTFSKISYSQQPSLTAYYSYSEKSRDSHTTVETFSLKGDVLAYTVKYTGRRGPDQKDENKTCRLSKEQVDNIYGIINKYELNVTDSIDDKRVTSQSPAITATIVLTLTKGSKTTKIKIKGEPAAMAIRPLYSNAAYLLDEIRQMLPGSH